MARKGGLIPMWSDREVGRWFDYFVDRAEEQIYKLLQRAGEEFVKIARKKGNYKDHTGNLRSSIGYVIVKDGDILTENYEQSTIGTDKQTGIREAKRLVSELTSVYSDGWVLVGVAAMPYAVYVEAIDCKDVATVAADHTEDWVRKQSKTLFDKLAEKGY
ncbi:HK97 gp10 family phage protein [Parabacteroides hominis]|uniref:HK97 gp10 family phage protein n=1 Tax=Parabacteroides hominis TaxID=2763057 RepID=A0ABR7DVT2_9BACT|nr:HK97 gp10 family phage protein [Parabacteroides hominis]MBC5635180.1 HK97 gp10 family phage protein [Parabacteroides hominis]